MIDCYNCFIVFSIGIILITSIGLLFHPSHFRNIILALFLILLGIFHLYSYLTESGLIINFPFVYTSELIISTLYGPVFMFYILSITNDKKQIEKKEMFHFIPFFSIIGFLLIFGIKIKMNFQNIITHAINGTSEIFFIISSIINIITLLYIFYVIYILVKLIIEGKSIKNRINGCLFVLLCLFSFLTVRFFITIKFTQDLYKYYNTLESIFLYLFFLLLLRYPYFFLYDTITEKKKINIKKTKSYLNKVDVEHLNKKLLFIMEEEKFYCDENISLSTLSSALEINPHQLSEFLNEFYNKNLNCFVNSYRINESKKILLNEPLRITLSVAYAVGFNSYSSFYTAFKKEVKLSPAEYRKRKLK